jgi:cyclophilin family peptidyl-prolyl cis-trans isomerase
MAVREKTEKAQMQDEAQVPATGGGWFQKLDEFGQKHARIILTVLAGVIVIGVLIAANIAFRRSEAERVSRAISEADSIADLRRVKEKHGGSSHLPLIILTLGNRLARENRLEEARAEYDDFLKRFADHPLADVVKRSRESVVANLAFETDRREALDAIPSLEGHPVRSAKLRDSLPRLREKLVELRREPDRKAEADAVEREINRIMDSPLAIGPRKERHPEIVLHVKDKDGQSKGTIPVELFEDEAPNTVAALVSLAESGAFKGAKIALVDTDARLHVTGAKQDYAIPFESTAREGLVGSLVLVRQGQNNAAAEFQILLKSADLPKDATICGIVPTPFAMNLARELKADDTIDSVTVEKKRSHEYKPRTVQP